MQRHPSTRSCKPEDLHATGIIRTIVLLSRRPSTTNNHGIIIVISHNTAAASALSDRGKLYHKLAEHWRLF
jgi:hypothetical protein